MSNREFRNWRDMLLSTSIYDVELALGIVDKLNVRAIATINYARKYHLRDEVPYDPHKDTPYVIICRYMSSNYNEKEIRDYSYGKFNMEDYEKKYRYEPRRV